MHYVFLLAMVCLIVYTVFSFLKKPFSEIVRLIAALAAAALSLIAGIAEPSLTSIGIGAAVCTLFSLLLPIVSKKAKNEGLKNFLCFFSKAIVITVIAETLIFNFNCFHLLKGYERATLDMSSASVTGFSESGGGCVSTGDTASIEFQNIDKKIGIIVLDMHSASDNQGVDYSIDFTDETNASYYIRTGLVKGKVWNKIEQTKYVVCDFSGKVGKLRINLSGMGDDGKNQVTLSAVRINEPYPSHFSYGRFFIIVLCAVFIWCFKRALTFRKAIDAQAFNTKAVTAVLILAAVFICVLMSSITMSANDFSMDTGNQMTKELVDAFEKGQVELDATPSPELLAMENPYDWSARSEQNVSALWDHVFYNGKYYSYYGIGPVLTIFLPYHLITGHYFPSIWATTLFTSLGLIFIGLFFHRLMKKLFPDIPLTLYTAALITVYASCGAWYCTIISNFYEIAQSSGFCCVAIGAYFLVKSNIFTKGEIRPHRLLLSSLFLALAVTCRPTTAVWCVAAVAFIIAGVFRLKREKAQKKTYVVYLLCALLPFAVIGGGQMIYNFVRFGSFTDFGIDYSLTINDFTRAEHHTQLAAIGFYDYLFAPPSFSGEFPYIGTNISTLGVNGYYFVATNNGCGLLFRALPVFALFAALCALKYVKKENKLRVAILFSLVAFVMPFVIIASVWESGYGVRYMMDFAFEMVTCAFLVIFMLYRHLKGKDAKRIYENLLLISMFLSLAVCVALTYSYFYPGSYVTGHEVGFENFARIFSIFNT